MAKAACTAWTAVSAAMGMAFGTPPKKPKKYIITQEQKERYNATKRRKYAEMPAEAKRRKLDSMKTPAKKERARKKYEEMPPEAKRMLLDSQLERKKQERDRLREARIASFIAANPGVPFKRHSKDDTARIVDAILGKDRDELGRVSIASWVATTNVCFYVGLTGRQLRLEDCCFLKAGRRPPLFDADGVHRGEFGRPYPPPVQWTDWRDAVRGGRGPGHHITRGEAVRELDHFSFTVYEDILLDNAEDVEEEMQKRLFPLGLPHRLWRATHPRGGLKRWLPGQKDPKVYYVFLSVFPRMQELIDSKKISLT